MFQGVLFRKDERGTDEAAPRSPSYVVIGLIVLFGLIALPILASVVYWNVYRRAPRRGPFGTPPGSPGGPAIYPGSIPLQPMPRRPSPTVDPDLVRAEEGRGRTLAALHHDPRPRGRDNSHRRVAATYPRHTGQSRSISTLPTYRPPVTPPPSYVAPRLSPPAPGTRRHSAVLEADDDDPTPRTQDPSPSLRRIVHLSSLPNATDPPPRPLPAPSGSPSPPHFRRRASSSSQTIDLNAPAPPPVMLPSGTQATDGSWATTTSTDSNCALADSPPRRSYLSPHSK